ncbi:hypothetical protein [Methylobacterium haplocladii]|uniref:Uncharacterized protein n=1 Tax=Methylobacterium haplocladii TaxID=1176176 RepID=A0A512ISW9_9HYPH|nr:hypothetical protein [Methylobacterium haplocladii]GEP00783.1 hypothetical protein MHA02_31700 [Methylobacterium haplocladii]GJD83118.1 hypothetical protein HPGCJGGD_0980 [Methylobacterium haplocladii]GLS59518.1 hypothetical protein GCM10007887_21870 [Methylobacterium haplocladii]
MSETTAKDPAGNNKADEHGKRPSDTPTGDKSNAANTQGKMEDRLDEALEETFPSSDPVSVKITK